MDHIFPLGTQHQASSGLWHGGRERCGKEQLMEYVFVLNPAGFGYTTLLWKGSMWTDPALTDLTSNLGFRVEHIHPTFWVKLLNQTSQ